MERIYLYIITGIIALLVGFLGFSLDNFKEKIEDLEIEIKSLKSNISDLDSLSKEYNSIHDRLTLRNKQLNELKIGIDSIMKNSISNLTEIESGLRDLIEKQKKYPKPTSTGESWRFPF